MIAALLSFIAGCGVGLVMGWMTNEMRRSRRAFEKANAALGEGIAVVISDDPGPVAHVAARRRWYRGERGGVDVTMLLVALLAATTVYFGWQGNKASDQAEASARAAVVAGEQAKAAASQVAIVTACNHRVLTSVLVALNERSSFTDAQFERSKDLENAQARLVATLLNHHHAAAELQDYFDALTAKRVADVKAAAQRDDYPFPDAKAIVECSQ